MSRQCAYSVRQERKHHSQHKPEYDRRPHWPHVDSLLQRPVQIPRHGLHPEALSHQAPASVVPQKERMVQDAPLAWYRALRRR